MAAAVSKSQLWLDEHKSKARALASCEVLEDRDHLQGLDPNFAHRSDVILCVDNGSTSLIRFLQHSVHISNYSSVVFQLLEAQRSNGVFDQQPLHLHLLKDTDSLYSSSAMRVAVSYLYPKGSRGSQSSTLSMDMLPMHAECMHLFHQYDMEEMLMTLDKGLKEPLKQLLKTAVAELGLNEVLKFVKVAEDCGCLSILTVCEAFIATKCLHDQTRQQVVFSSGLTHASTGRVCEGVIASHKREMQAMMAALDRSAAEAQFQGNDLFFYGMCCQRCICSVTTVCNNL